MIKAVLENGVIRPVEPLPPDWRDGQELMIEAGAEPSPGSIDAWADDLERGVARISPEEHERFLRGLEEVERESKEAVRREWGLG